MKALGVVQHDTHSCGAANHGLAGKPFPHARAGVEHVGAVYVYEGGRETVRQIDLTLLKESRGAADCVPAAEPGAARKLLTINDALADAAPVGAGDARAGGGARSSTAWQGGGLCAARVAPATPALLHWPRAWVDALRADGKTAAFTHADAVLLGGAGYVPASYVERVPPTVEPIQALDGGVRYAAALVLAEPALGAAAAAPSAAAAAAFARDDVPRILLALARPDALLLLPPTWAAAVRGALAAARTPAERALATRVIDHEASETALYYAADVYVFACA